MTRLRAVTHFGVQARKSIREYLEAIRLRYEKATKEEKGRILDEFTKTTGIHRKSVIRLLNRSAPGGSTKRRGRPRKYGAPVAEALRSIWEASDRLFLSLCRS